MGVIKYACFFALFTGAVFGASAQFVPQGISYQSIARATDGDELINTLISLRISILAGSADGQLEWEELHAANTNDYGLFTLVIGQGLSTAMGSVSSFDAINWAAAPHFLKVEIDGPGTGTYELMGTSELLAVPYAFHAATADQAPELDGDTSNELITYLGISNNELEIVEGGQSHTVSLNIIDGDSDSTNELINSMAYESGNNNLQIDQSGNTFTADFSDLEDGDWTDSGSQVTNTTQMVGIGTASPTSTFQTGGSVAAAFITLSNGATYNAGSSDQYILCSVTDSYTITVNLPTASTCPGRMYTVKRIVQATGDVALVASVGDQVEGSASLILSLPVSEIVSVISDGSNWWVVNYTAFYP